MDKDQKKELLNGAIKAQGTQAIPLIIDLLNAMLDSEFTVSVGTGATEGGVTTQQVTNTQSEIDAFIDGGYKGAEAVVVDGTKTIKFTFYQVTETTYVAKSDIDTGKYVLTLSKTASSSTLVYTAF